MAEMWMASTSQLLGACKPTSWQRGWRDWMEMNVHEEDLVPHVCWGPYCCNVHLGTRAMEKWNVSCWCKN